LGLFLRPAGVKKVHRDPKERDSVNHVQAVLIQGLENNYAGMTQHCPDSRYLVISLSFDAQGEDKPARGSRPGVASMT
jgi:hypothetical protein